ncbi:ankyrin repeat-containing protein [European chub iridovirus]|nr:ankyrin repeat-containing protein [European chub iridovirus]
MQQCVIVHLLRVAFATTLESQMCPCKIKMYHQFNGSTGQSVLARLIHNMGDESIGIIMHTPELNDINMLNRICCLFSKETPCHLAAKQGNHRLLSYLISQKAYDKNARDLHGKSVQDVYVKPCDAADQCVHNMYNLNVEEMQL